MDILVETNSDDNVVSRFTRGYEIVSADIIDETDYSHSFVVVSSSIPTNFSLSRYYYSVDEQNSNGLITYKYGKIRNVYWHDAFGNVIKSREYVNNRIKYTSQRFDEITQQYYLRAKFYNPVVGRFTQEDIYRGDGLNLYAYCGNNPVGYYDPSGYSSTFQSNIYDPNQYTDPKKYIDPGRLDIEKAANKKATKGIVIGNFTDNISMNGSRSSSPDGKTITIPQEVAQKLIGKDFNNFDDFRKELWMTIGNSKY